MWQRVRTRWEIRISIFKTEQGQESYEWIYDKRWQRQKSEEEDLGWGSPYYAFLLIDF